MKMKTPLSISHHNWSLAGVKVKK